jgi:signal transduction histidine kinase
MEKTDIDALTHGTHERVGGRSRSPKAKTLIAFSVLIMLLFCGFVAYQASKAYTRSVEDGRANATRLTKILSDDVELTFLAVDLTLRRAVERQYFNTMFGGNLPHDIENNFRLWVEETPQIAALMLVDDKGTIEVAANKRGYDQWYNYQDAVSDDPAFKAMQEDSERNYYIGQQRTRNADHPQLIVMSRRISKLDGSFGGVIIAAIDPRFFSDFFTSVDNGSHRFMALMLDSGAVLYTGPDDNPSRGVVLDYVGDQASHTHDHAIVTNTKTFNDSIKIYSYVTLKNLPITTAVVIDEKDFLSDWHHARLKDISFLAIFTIFGSVLSYFALNMAKQIIRVEESESAAILASQAKSEFLANMSHELRTPLNAVIGFSEMLAAGYFGALNEKQKERVLDINLCGTHLLQLISDILEFSKGEAGKLELYEEDMDVRRAVEESARIVAERAKAKHIALNVDLAEPLPLLHADKRKVRQILLNLLSNAIKFTPPHGTVTVAVRITPQGQMQFAVTDTGIGIAEEDIPTALAVFGQVHRSQSHEGTGLGLPLCKMFAELHGGMLQLSSVVGEGTTVRVIFPESRVRQ